MQLRMDARVRRWVRRLPGVNVYSLAELLLIAGLAVQSARLIWTIATPVSPLGDWRPATPVLAGSPSDILDSFDPFFRSGGAPVGTVTALQLTLYGTRLDEAGGRDAAILAGPDGVQKSFAVGEEVQPGVRLKAVAFDHVTLDRGGASEDLFLDQSGPASPVQPGSAAAGPGAAPGLPPAPPTGQGIALDRLRHDIGASPRIASGRIDGLVVHPQGPAFAQAGFRDGDVVTAIGGRPVSGPQDLDRLAVDYRQGGAVPVVVDRGGQPVSLSLLLAPAS